MVATAAYHVALQREPFCQKPGSLGLGHAPVLPTALKTQAWKAHCCHLLGTDKSTHVKAQCKPTASVCCLPLRTGTHRTPLRMRGAQASSRCRCLLQTLPTEWDHLNLLSLPWPCLPCEQPHSLGLPTFFSLHRPGQKPETHPFRLVLPFS